MPLPRRELLRLGAAAALSAAATACHVTGSGSGAPLPSTSPSPSGTARPSPACARKATTARGWAGEPPPGQLYFGASLPYGRSVRGWERQLGSTLSVHRSYYRPDADETAQMIWQCRHDIAHQRLPHVSTKTPGSWRDVAAGYHDDWALDLLRQLAGLASPVLLTVHHEPENDAGAVGMQSQDFVAMQRRVLDMAARTAPQVTVVPVIQHWSFEPLRGRIDPTAWIVDEATVLGIDVYNPWSPTNGNRWRSFGSRVEEVFAWIGERPLVIGEYGCREDPQNPGVASQWLRDAVAYAQSRPVVSMSYFNSGVNARDGSFELYGEAERTFAELLAEDWVARIA